MKKSTTTVVPVMLLVLCLVAVNGEVPADGDGHGDGHSNGHSGSHGQESCVCTRNEYLVRESFGRTCKQDLLTDVQYVTDQISADVKQVAATSYVLQRGLAYFTSAQETSTDELEDQIRQGFDNVRQDIATNNQLILNQSTNVIASNQRSIDYMKQVGIRFYVFLFVKIALYFIVA